MKVINTTHYNKQFIYLKDVGDSVEIKAIKNNDITTERTLERKPSLIDRTKSLIKEVDNIQKIKSIKELTEVKQELKPDSKLSSYKSDKALRISVNEDEKDKKSNKDSGINKYLIDNKTSSVKSYGNTSKNDEVKLKYFNQNINNLNKSNNNNDNSFKSSNTMSEYKKNYPQGSANPNFKKSDDTIKDYKEYLKGKLNTL